MKNDWTELGWMKYKTAAKINPTERPETLFFYQFVANECIFTNKWMNIVTNLKNRTASISKIAFVSILKFKKINLMTWNRM